MKLSTKEDNNEEIKIKRTEARLVPTEDWSFPMDNEEFKERVHGFCIEQGILRSGYLHIKLTLSEWGILGAAVYQDRGYLVGLVLNLTIGTQDFVVVPDNGEIPFKTYQDFSKICDCMLKVYCKSRHNVKPETLDYRGAGHLVCTSDYGKGSKGHN